MGDVAGTSPPDLENKLPQPSHEQPCEAEIRLPPRLQRFQGRVDRLSGGEAPPGHELRAEYPGLETKELDELRPDLQERLRQLAPLCGEQQAQAAPSGGGNPSVPTALPPPPLGVECETRAERRRRLASDPDEQSSAARWRQLRRIKAAARRKRAEDKEGRHHTRMREHWDAVGLEAKRRPPTVSCAGWGHARWAICTIDGASYSLRWLADRRGGQFVARLADAAYSGGRFDLADPECRKLIGLAVFLVYEARWKPWSRSASGRVLAGQCVRGIGQSLLAALLADPGRDVPVDRTTVWRYLERGAQAKLWEAVQVPVQVAEPWEIGRTPRGEYARNRYWLCTHGVQKPALDDGRDSAAESERGWRIVLDPPERIMLRDRRRGVVPSWLPSPPPTAPP